ncbi:unnamed protein product, partial [marine sediment metagenome]
QTLTFTNNSEQDLNLSLLLKNQIEADKIYWDGEYYPLSENPRKFSNPDKVAFYAPSEEYLSFYDFSDIPDEFNPELWAEKKDSQTILILSLNISIPANSSKTIDPEYSSLKAKEELPEKTTITSKTYIKTLPTLEKRYVWNGTVGDVHYKDNYADPSEQWKDIDLTWEGNRITKAPYELTHEGNKLTLKDKQTGNITTIELDSIGGKKIPDVDWERSKGLARAPGITTIEDVTLDTDLEVIAEFS